LLQKAPQIGYTFASVLSVDHTLKPTSTCIISATITPCFTGSHVNIPLVLPHQKGT